MKKMLFGIVVIGLLVGCAKPLHVKVDDAIVNDLPKEVALKFLREVSETPGNQMSKFSCLIEKGGVRIREGHGRRAGLYAPWQELKLADFMSGENRCKVSVTFGSSIFGAHKDCRIVHVDVRKEKLKMKKLGARSEYAATDYQKLCSQTATALKSLGVK